jgi:hypothetical protein
MRRCASVRTVVFRHAVLAACIGPHLTALAQQTGEPAPPLPAPTQEAAEAERAPVVERPAPAHDPAKPEQAPVVEQVLDTTRRALRATTEWLARAVDGSFGDKSFDEGGKVIDGRFDLIVHKRERELREIDQRFNARFRLPNLERRIHVFLGNDDERDVVTDSPEAFTQRQRLRESRATQTAFFAGIKLPFLDAFEFRLGVRGPFKPFAQASYDRAWRPTEADTFEFRETLFWTVADHFGSTTVGSYAHALSPTLVARGLTAVTIAQVTERFEWNSVVGTYQTFGEQRVLSLEALASGAQGTGVRVSEYGAQVRWEQPLHDTWLLGEVGVGHFWPRASPLSERERVWALSLALKLKF